MPAVLWPDVEAAVTSYLRTALAARPESYAAGVTVANREPHEPNEPHGRPTRLVVVRDDGGPALDDVRAVARIGVRVWAGTYEDAADLANLVCALVAAVPGPAFRRAQVSRPYAIEDESEHPLRFFTAELVVVGDALS